MAVNIDLQPIFDEIDSQNSALSLEFSKLIYEKYISARSIREMHNIQVGIKCGSKIPFADRGSNYDYMQHKEDLTSNCDFNECDVTTTFSVKAWETKEYNCRVSLCRKDLECDFNNWWDANDCGDADNVGGNFIKFLVDWIGTALIESHWTKVWFAESSLPTTSKLYGADGLFVRMEAIAPPSNVEQRIEIPENAALTYAAQNALDPQRGFEVFNGLYNLAMESFELSGRSDIYIDTTKKLALNYLQYLRTNNQVDCCERDTTTNNYALDSLKIFGLPIRVVNEWDSIIRGTKSKSDPTPIFAELNDGTRWTNPHRAVLTYKDNIPVGVCQDGKLENVDILYNPFERRINIDSEYEIGANILLDNEFALAI